MSTPPQGRRQSDEEGASDGSVQQVCLVRGQIEVSACTPQPQPTPPPPHDLTGFYEERTGPQRRPMWTLRLNHIGRYVAGLLTSVRHHASTAQEVHWFVGVGDSGIFETYTGPTFHNAFADIHGSPTHLQLVRGGSHAGLAFRRVRVAGTEITAPLLSDAVMSQLPSDFRAWELQRFSGWDLNEIRTAVDQLNEKVIALLRSAWPGPGGSMVEQADWAHRGRDVNDHISTRLFRRGPARPVGGRHRGPIDDNSWHADDLGAVVVEAQVVLHSMTFPIVLGGDHHSAWHWLTEIRRQRKRAIDDRPDGINLRIEFPDDALERLGVPTPGSPTYHYYFSFESVSGELGGGAHGEAQVIRMRVWEVPDATANNRGRDATEIGVYSMWIVAAGVGWGGGGGRSETTGRAKTHEPWSSAQFPGRVGYMKWGVSASLGPRGMQQAEDHIVLYGNGERTPMQVSTPATSASDNPTERLGSRPASVGASWVTGMGWVHARNTEAARRFTSSMPMRESQVAGYAREQLSFGSGQARLSPAGRDVLGMFLASEQALFWPPRSSRHGQRPLPSSSSRAQLELHAHASRRDRDDANLTLTHYRNENVVQVIADVLGVATGDVFAVGAHAEGETVAARERDPSTSDLAIRRRVNVTLANRVTVTLWAR